MTDHRHRTIRLYALLATCLVAWLIWPQLAAYLFASLPFALFGLFMPPLFAGCDIFTDDFSSDRTGTDYTIGSGSWTVSGGILTTGSTGARIIENSSGSTGHGRLSVRAKVDTSGAAIRLIAYTDSSNYLFGELTINGASSTLKLWKKVAGSDSQIGSTCTFTGSINTYYSLALCWDGSIASVSGLNTPDCCPIGAYSTTHNKAGLGANPNSGTATFDDFSFAKHKTDDSSCLDCTANCPQTHTDTCAQNLENCVDGVAPISLLASVTLTIGADDCSTVCTDEATGSHVLTNDNAAVHLASFSPTRCSTLYTEQEQCIWTWSTSTTFSASSPCQLTYFTFLLRLAHFSDGYRLHAILALGYSAVDHVQLQFRSSVISTSPLNCGSDLDGVTLSYECTEINDECAITGGSITISV